LPDAVERVPVARKTFALWEGDVDLRGRPVRVGHLEVLDGIHLLDGKDGRLELQLVALIGLHLEQITLLSNVRLERHDDSLTNRVDRWVGDLSEQLTEIVVDGTGRGGNTCDGSIVTHGS
jgi:hypothetical protein